MSEKALSLALEKQIDTSLESYCCSGQISDGYRFSREFELKMERIIGLPKQNVGRRISIKRRLRLAVMIAAIFAAGILVGAAKRPIWNLIVGEDSKQVAFEADTSAAQKTMGLAYTLTEIPEGYTLADKHITPSSACEYYMTDSGSYIFFTQETVSNFEQYSAGDAKGEYYTFEGIQYFVYTVGGSISVKWFNGDYIFSLYSTLDKDTALKLCKTAKVQNAAK